MKILSHRGYWQSTAEKNSPVAFERSFTLGFGTETDVRDCMGRLVISHDMPSGNELSLEHFLSIYADRNLPLAINIKCDGMAAALKQAMQKSPAADWFVFDMSVPDMRSYLRTGITAFARMSEVEKDPAWIEEVAGIWLDGFSQIWYDNALIMSLLNKGLRVCIVSPELHQREHLSFWQDIAALSGQSGLMLCTDFPEQARDFFGAEV